MKRFLSLMVCCISFVSCNTPQSVAEKALDLVGSGIFYGTLNAEKITMFSKYEDIFNDCLYRNSQVEYLRENGCLSEYASRDDYFQIASLFERYELISDTKHNISLYNYIDCYPERVLEEEMNKYSTIKYSLEQAEELCTSQLKYILRYYPDCIPVIGYMTYLEYKDIPFHILKYKIDNQKIASIYVIKIPEKGYRVCGLWFE